MNRRPIYHPNNPRYRIVSVPNGLWEVQHDTYKDGDMRRPTYDPWVSLGYRPTTREHALQQMQHVAR